MSGVGLYEVIRMLCAEDSEAPVVARWLLDGVELNINGLNEEQILYCKSWNN